MPPIFDHDDVLERRVILLSLGNFASRPLCKKVFLLKSVEIAKILDSGLSDDDREIQLAAQRLKRKVEQV